MARRKVQLAWIVNSSSRRSTFRKRRDCLLRKVMEISTLTGEDACGIVMSPDEGDAPVFWPSSIDRVLERYFGLPEAEQCKKMITLDSFLQDKICNMGEQLEKEKRKARDEGINYLMHSIYSHGKPIGSLTLGELHVLFLFLEELEKKCELRFNLLNQEKGGNSLLLPIHPSPPPPLKSPNMFINDFYGQPMPGHYDSTDGDSMLEIKDGHVDDPNANYVADDDSTNVHG